MLNPTVFASKQIAVLDAIDPDAQGAGAVTTAWVNAGLYGRLLAVVMAGDLGASATLDAKIEQATDGSGSGAKDVTGLAITQLTQAGTDSDKQVLIEIDPAALDINNGFEFVRLSMTVGTATSETAGLLLGLAPRYGAVSHVASVDEIVGD